MILDRVLVGFAPRQHAYNPITGAMQYLRWQHTWWNGVYSIMLTKVSFFHKDYLNDFFEVRRQLISVILM